MSVSGDRVPPRNARYPQIAADIRERLARGEWEPGGRLPTLDELAEQYGANKNTVLRAIRILELEGLLRSAPRRGVIVSPAQPPAR